MTRTVESATNVQNCNHYHLFHPLCENYGTIKKIATIAFIVLFNIVTLGIPLLIYGIYSATTYFSKKSPDSNGQNNQILKNAHQSLANDPTRKNNSQQIPSLPISTNQPVPSKNTHPHIINSPSHFDRQSSPPATITNPPISTCIKLNNLNTPENSSDEATSSSDEATSSSDEATSSSDEATSSSGREDSDTNNNASLESPRSPFTLGNDSTTQRSFLPPGPSPCSFSTSSASSVNSQTPTPKSANPLETIQNLTQKVCTEFLDDLEKSDDFKGIINYPPGTPVNFQKDQKSVHQENIKELRVSFQFTFKLDKSTFSIRIKQKRSIEEEKEEISQLPGEIKKLYDSNASFKQLIDSAQGRYDDALEIQFHYYVDSSNKLGLIEKTIKNPFKS